MAGCSGRLPDTPLFRDVDAMDLKAGAQAVRTRLEHRYAVGRPEAGLAAYLRGQGMHVARTAKAGPTGVLRVRGEASARGVGKPCPKVAMVIWRADAAGVIRELSVLYEQAACV